VNEGLLRAEDQRAYRLLVAVVPKRDFKRKYIRVRKGWLRTYRIKTKGNLIGNVSHVLFGIKINSWCGAPVSYYGLSTGGCHLKCEQSQFDLFPDYTRFYRRRYNYPAPVTRYTAPCPHQNPIPYWDRVLGQYLSLKYDEKTYREVSNSFWSL
jgi:hypothetical protein